MESTSSDNERGSEEAPSSGWFLVAQHALPEEWQDRAIPVYLVPLSGSDVERLQPRDHADPRLDEEDRAVARLVARGVPPHELAARLHLSRRSVFRRLARLRQLTGSSSNVQLATKLAKQDIFEVVDPAPAVTTPKSPSYLRTQQIDASGSDVEDEEAGGAR